MVGPEFVVPFFNDWEIILTTHDSFQVLRIGVRSEEELVSSFVMYSKEKQFDSELLEQLGKIERREHKT